MRRFFTSVSVMLLSVAMMSGSGQGRGRQNYNTGSNTSSSQNRSSSPARPSSNSGRPSTPSRPSNHGNDNNRPSNPGNNNGRPSNHGNNGNRPSYPGNNNGRPSNPGNNYNHRPPTHNGYHNPGHNHGYRPNSGRPAPVNPHYGHPTPPPTWGYRPYLPAYRPWSRPTPPPSFRPYAGCPVITSILGVTLGAALDFSLNYWLNSGYSIAGYGSNAIYLSNVALYNYSWPAATMYYNNGTLAGSEFIYSSPAYDMTRYNMLYNQLVRQYGYPVSTQNQNGTISATWWGNNNGYITLSFYNDYAYNGTYRYYTSLSIGN